MINKLLKLGVLVGFMALFVMQIYNHFHFPWQRGFDAGGHLEYINFLKSNLTVPDPSSGWEMYQPPVYYAIGALFGSPQTIQFINLFAWIIVIGAIGYLLKFNLSILLLTASLPVGLTLSHTISNELWSAAVITVLLIYFYQTRFSTRKQLIIGAILAVVAVLSKATGWIAVAVIMFELLLTKKFKHIFIIGVLLLFGSGWFYGRNILLYRNPFIASVDFEQYKIDQLPGYRNLAFFTDLSGFVKADLFLAHWYSFIPGTYFSWFWDAHNIIVPVQARSTIGTIIFFWSVPVFFTSMYGIYVMAKKQQYRMWLLYAVLLIAAYASYNIKLPFFSTVKAAFIVSLLPLFALSIQAAMDKLDTKYRPLAYAYFLLLTPMIIHAFTIRTWWY